VNIRNTLLSTIVLVLALAGVAPAVELVTPPLNGASADEVLCTILNKDAVARDVTIEVRDQNGQAVDSASFDLSRRAVASLSKTVSTGARYCRFSVEGPKNRYRAAGCLVRGSPSRCVIALPAR
jgi:hypothetical protein